jgi:HNH endonuclease
LTDAELGFLAAQISVFPRSSPVRVFPQIAIPFEIDHILAQKHGGPIREENLALSCFYCNSYKGPHIAGVDPASERIVRLFHPRRDRWSRHFERDGATLRGKTAIGRATIVVLSINNPDAIAVREALIEEGVFPGAR